MANTPESTPGRLETILAYMVVGVVGVSIISIAVALISTAVGQTKTLAIFAQLPLIGLPVGMLLVIALLLVSLCRRSRENRSNNN